MQEMPPCEPQRRDYSLTSSHHRRREYSPLPPRGPEYSPPLAHRREVQQALQSEPFTDSRNCSRHLGVSSAHDENGRRHGLASEIQTGPLERRTLDYRNEHLQNRHFLRDHPTYGDSASARFQWDHLLAEEHATIDVGHARDIGAAYGSEPPSRIYSEKVYPGNEVFGTDLVANHGFLEHLSSGANDSGEYGYYDANASMAMRLENDHLNYNNLLVQGRGTELCFRDDLPQSGTIETVKIYRDRFPLHSVAFNRNSSVLAEGAGVDEYGQVPPARSYKEHVIGDYAYSEGRRDVHNDSYVGMASVREKYGLQDMLRARCIDSSVSRIERAENSMRDSPRGGMQFDDQGYVTRASHERWQDDDFYGIEHGRLAYFDGENQLSVEENGLGEVGNGSWPFGDGLRSVPSLKDAEDFYETDLISKHRLTSEELRTDAVDQSGRILKRKRGFDKSRLGYSTESLLYRNQIVFDLSFGEEDWIGDSEHLNVEMSYYPDPNKRSSVPDDISGDLTVGEWRNLRKSGATYKGVKKRLGRQLNARIYPWVNRRPLHDHGNPSHEEDDSSETMADAAEAEMNFAKVEPPEESDEFKQMINSAFLKFVKLLYENPAQRRNYTDQGQSAALKCGVCGRKSKEFVNTRSLVMHAFGTRVAGLRAEHLGLHKALCLLMGWNSAAITNGTWVRHSLPYSQVLALRDDLIIWPPLVVTHYSSYITNAVPDERVILSIEGLKAILKDMGIGSDKAKVVRWKPEDHSIVVVVIFHATISGLLEAEKLHKYFGEKGRGKTEFDLISCSNRTRGGRAGKAPPDEVSVLYGYLGVAEDLDKLEKETKKRCVVKSRKEIQDIMDTRLKPE